MTTRDFTANVISATKVVPDGNFKDSAASGVWDINEALDLIKGGNWPNAANINPAAFVDALFSTFLYDGTGSNLEINNGINLSGKGGLVWAKRRNGNDPHWLVDTERGLNKSLQTNDTAADNTGSDQIVSFDSDGFTLGNRNEGQNYSGLPYVSWTFRKQPKFFDVVTYSSNQSSSQTINHNLGSVPGMIIVKRTDATSQWVVYHREADSSNPEEYALNLNTTGVRNQGSSFWNNTAPTSTQFTVGNNASTNDSDPANYVAYLFAHNNNDGGFGEPGDQDIIKCGSYTGNNSTDGPTINLGFEPQWLFIKHTDADGNSSFILDSMRGIFTGSADPTLSPNAAQDEQDTQNMVDLTSTGFQIKRANSNINGSSKNYIYMAIRRGGMQTPTVGTDVFHVNKFTTTGFSSYNGVGFAPDLAIQKAPGSGSEGWDTIDKLRGPTKYFVLNETNTEQNDTQYSLGGFLNDGVKLGSDPSNGQWAAYNPNMHYYWKRANGYFDIVCWEGSGTSGYETINHNLGVTPEMVWFKNRDSNSNPRGNWYVYHKDLTNSNGYVFLNTTPGEATDYPGWATGTFAPSSTQFTMLKNTLSYTNESYVGYFFATAAGVSKVGSFSGNSGTQTIDCGFSGGNGARFVVIKAISTSGNWFVWDSARGIVSGNDSYLLFNSTAAEETSYDSIDPHESGFTLNNVGSGTNDSGTTYIFYAIA
jgi:hypothetical protein